MNIVNESNLGKIKSVFNDNASNSHYYKIIHKTFKESIKNLEFAKPIIQVNNGVIIWQSFSEGPYLNYAGLDRQNKSYIDSLIQDSLNEIAATLGVINDENFLENIIEIPGEEAIFYTKDSSNNIKVILTEWGYTKDEHIKREGVLKKIFSSTMKSFIIKFKSNKNESLEGINAVISSEDLNIRETSDRAGVIKINNIKKGNTIVISSLNGNFEEVTIKVNTIEDCTIIVERSYTLTFNVIDSNSSPVAHETFYFTSDLLKNKKFQTDVNGNYQLQHLEKDGDFQVFSGEREELLYENLPSQDQTYQILYNPPLKEDTSNLENQVVDSVLADNIELEFLNWRRKPITNQSIDIYGHNGKTSYVTDDKGIVSLDTLNKDVEHAIFMDFKGAHWKKEFTPTDSLKYTFTVKRKRFLWLWLPAILFFLLLLLIPTEVVHHYRVLDKNTKQPISLADVSSTKSNIFQVQNSNIRTDSLGGLSIAYGKHTLYKQIFKESSTDFYARKSGYENLTGIVDLAYFKTQKSTIYLNRLPLAAINEDETIEVCNSGGDADNAGGNSIKEFDLKQDKGGFVFAYHTGDLHADIIKIYDCPKSEIMNNQPIWSVNEASGREKYVAIKFSSRIVTIQVVGGGNTQSIWQYVVECPK